MPNALVLNAGSSSLKWLVLDASSEGIVKQGSATWDAIEGGRHEAEMRAALSDLPVVDAVGHRVVHGGSRFREAARVDDGVRGEIAELSELAPLHNPAALAGIEAARKRFPSLPQVACFDTAFHSTIERPAALYPVPYVWSERWGVRRYGFHGLSVQYAVGRAGEVLGAVPRRLVVCHLGAGCSATAVLDGRSVDTSMGFTPLEGLMMVRRSGSVDPGLLLHLVLQRGVGVADLERLLNEESGVLGVSGVSADMRAVLAAAEAGHERAGLAVDMFVHRLVASVGGFCAVLGGLDGLVFTGGIGEHSAEIRSRVCSALSFLGVRLDGGANSRVDIDADVALADSKVRVLVIAAREDLVIVREMRRLLGWL